jgi:DNA invertase Pin-like site-specific DNA recombinase
MNAKPQTPARTIRAAIYARVSTEEQAGDGKTSLDEQVRLCTDNARARGWEVVGEYIDAGISGTDRSRPRWQAMLAAARSREIDAVVVLKLDRFARNAGAIITETDNFLDLGVRFAVCDPDIDMSTPTGRLFRTQLAGFAEFERDLIVGRTVAGQRAKALRGGRPGGEPPYGWKVAGEGKDTYLEPNDDERRTITEAVHCLLRRHMNPQQIADHLNDLGMRPRKAARWNPDVLRRMLANPALYTGKSVWGAKESGTFYKRSHHTRLDRDGEPLHGKQIEITLPEPPLTKTQHRSIVRAIERRSTRGKSATAKTQMLSTRLVGACGKHYIGVSLSAKDYDVYRCSGRKHINGPDKCECKQVRADTLDTRVWDEIKSLFGSPERLEGMAREWLAIGEDGDLMDYTAIVARLDQEIERKRRALTRAVDAQFDADDPAEHDDRIARFRSELSGLVQRREAHAALVHQQQEQTERVTDLVALAERARGRLETMPDEARREIVEILDIRVSMIGDIAVRLPERVSEPERVRITGIIDPRLFGDADASNRGGSAGSPSDFSMSGKSSSGEGWPRWDSPACWW